MNLRMQWDVENIYVYVCNRQRRGSLEQGKQKGGVKKEDKTKRQKGRKIHGEVVLQVTEKAKKYRKWRGNEGSFNGQ